MVGFDERKIKILETPTLLKRLFLKGEMSAEEYAEKLTIYIEAIKIKKDLSKEIKDTGERYQLRDYQRKIVEYGSQFKSFAIFDEPRLGKTPTIIELIKEKALIDGKVLVVSPGKVIGNWIKRFKEWANKDTEKYEGEPLDKKRK